MTRRRPARVGALLALGVPVACAVAACGLFDPFPDLAAAPSDDASTESSTSTLDDAGSIDASRCVTGTTRPCGFEMCTGTEQCQADGGWTTCNARKPSLEQCDTAFDESCDGVGSCTGEGRWVRAFGDSRVQHVTAITTDDDGNVYAVGFYDGNLVLPAPDGGVVMNTGDNLVRDGFLLKLSPTGGLQWAESIPDAPLSAVALRGSEIVVGGTNLRPTTISGCSGVGHVGGGDILVARFDLSGKCVKVASYGAPSTETLTGLAIDPVNGDIVAVGVFSGNLAFGGADGGAQLADAHMPSGYMVRLDRATLEGRYASLLSGTRIQVTGVTVTPDQRTVVVGWFIGPRGLANDAHDGFIKVFLPGGEHAGTFTVGAESSSFSPLAIAFDRNRANTTASVIVAGLVSGIVVLPGGTVLETPSTYGGMFLARVPTVTLSSPWTGRWYGAEGLERPYSVATDDEGNILLAGEVSGRADLGGGAFEMDDFDAFVAKYDPLLGHRWSHAFGGAGRQASWSVATDPLGNVFVGGLFEGATTFGDGGALVEAGTNADGFVLRRRP